MRSAKLWLWLILAGTTSLAQPDNPVIDVKTVRSWCDKMSYEMTHFARVVTNVDKLQYSDVEISPIVGIKLVAQIAQNIEGMMNSKVDAIKRVMDVAESSALTASTSEAPPEPPDDKYFYRDAKNYTHFNTSLSEHFGGDVNLNFSAVHVPTTVYGRAKEVLRAIRWSEELDNTFKNNYLQDPSLSWQYFGSSTGFMRQYPAINWKPNGSDPHDPDLFDCRTRSWYIEAATSPKDVLILVDTSGSMTGMRKEIARHVVNNILDTLGNNDYVNIVKFSNVTELAVPCFGDTLVQANLANIRELKNGISEMNTERIANFSMILTYAFELLEEFREMRRGACCNQAIMLVTDGVPDNYKEIFQRYNWASNPDNPDQADMPVRIFTYLIGREVADVRDSRWMACANRGYFVHLSTLAEVREQVLNYIAVMARPLVLNLTVHPTIWTPVYADIADPKITDWLWDKKERYDQKERYWIYRRNKKFQYLEQELAQYVKRSRKHPNLAGEMYKYRLMTSVSMPVFDRRENATRIANLLGVAGTDIPVDDIKQLMMPHVLGVHGYAFIVTNNGYILTHPDLRPVFQGILKPAYNSVDMAEVELMEGDEVSREFDELLLKFRETVVNQSAHSDAHMLTKYHYENMKRVGRMKRKYDSAPIKNTPFTVVVSLPLFNNQVSTYHVQTKKDPRRLNLDAGIQAVKYFEGNNWRIHPDWLYCKSPHKSAHKLRKKQLKHSINKHYKTSLRNPYHFENAYSFATPEEELRHFLRKINQPLWKWGTMPSEQSRNEQTLSGKKTEENTDSRYCDRDLILSLVYDAIVTKRFDEPLSSDSGAALARLMNLLTSEDLYRRFGHTLSFVATRSGLMRWRDFPDDEKKTPSEPPPDHFSKMHPRAIDEIWYKRAVEQYYVQPESLVFSIPIDEDGATNSTLVTVSSAIFVGNDDSIKAPAAVVGFQMTHTALQGFFQNNTLPCANNTNTDCFLVDNHAYIIAAKEASKAGRFLGDVNGLVMSSLVEHNVFEKITVFDYQAVCFRDTQESNDGNILLTPLKTVAMAASWLYGQMAFSLAKAGFWSYDYAEAVAYPNDDVEIELDKVTIAEEPPIEPESMNDNVNKPAAEIKDDGIYDNLIRIKRTRPEPCDQKVDLYLLRGVTEANAVHDDPNTGITGCDHLKYIVQPVNSTNMILLMIDTQGCQNVLFKMSTDPQELAYTQNSSLACQKTSQNLPRRRPQTCIRNHPKESEIKDLCGRAATGSRLDLRLVGLVALAIVLGVTGH
ncbi:voltage-dependent calcium channel subunit alpha-2/delta-3 isoform X4 [Nasonia vitripennis]|uniref:VWFA domain-containing protein n=1 Tax=Nasonia vitripennis TaxID=7425 RepID=A0A7M7QGI1_NASVI|nr:voltage-dependent calcium channel subunit alpha-2/delta-3 isoform X4 [Nasonia vitripennis]